MRPILCVVVASIALIGLVNSMFAQTNLSEKDKIFLSAIANDTSQLRQITLQHQGQPVAARAQNMLARYFYAKRMNNDAEREYTLTHDQFPGTAEAAEAAGRLGSLSYWNDRWEKAIPLFQEYLKTNPVGREAQWAWYSLIRSMFYMNDSGLIDAATSYLASSHDSTASRDALIHYDLLRYLGNNKLYDRAVEEGNKILREYPNSDYINFTEMRIAKYNMGRGNSEAAIQQCNTMLEKYPANSTESAAARHLLASMYMQIGDFDRARTEFQKVGRNYPDKKDFVNAAEYGIALVDLQDGNKRSDSSIVLRAFQELQSFLQNRPHDKNVPKASMDVAGLFMSKARFSDAAKAYSSVIGFDPAYIDTTKYASHTEEMKEFRELVTQAHLAKASLLRFQLHDPASAVADYDAVLNTDPGMPDALINKALCLIDLGKTGEARTILQKMVSEQTPMSEVAQKILSSF